MKTAVAYIRASTEEQQTTLTAQQDRVATYCAWKGLDLVDSFIDSGVSGSVPFLDRPEGAALLEFREAAGIPAIIIAKVDRAFRNTADCLVTIQGWHQAGIEVHLLDLEVDTSTANGMLFLTMTAALAQWELTRRRERQMDALHVMRREGRRLGEVPYGWMALPAPGGKESRRGNVAMNLIPDPAEQRVLRDHIIPLHQAGHTPTQIARQLNLSGIRTKLAGQTYERKISNGDGTFSKVTAIRKGKWHPIVVDRIVNHLDQHLDAA